MTLFLRLALRNAFRNRAYSLMAVGAIAVGCAALIVNAGVVFNIFRELREDAIWGRYGHLQIYRRGYTAGHLAEPDRYLLSPGETSRILEAVGANPRVVRTTRRRGFSGLISSGSRSAPFVGVGVEPEADAEFSRHTQMRRGEPLTSADPYGVLAGIGLSRKMGADAEAPLTLMATTSSGALNAVHIRMRGVFEGGLKEYDDWTLKIPIPAVEHLLMDDRTEQIVVLIARTEETAHVRAELERAFEGLDVEVRAWNELAVFHNQVVSLFGRELDIIRLIVCVLVMVAIGSAVALSIMDRRLELAAMRAIGLSARSVAALVMTEACVTGLAGAALGATAGIGAAWAITFVGIPYPSPPGSTRPFRGGVDVIPAEVVSAIATSVAATMLSAAGPALLSARSRIGPALRRG